MSSTKYRIQYERIKLHLLVRLYQNRIIKHSVPSFNFVPGQWLSHSIGVRSTGHRFGFLMMRF